MTTFRLDKLYFDEAAAGISSGINFDAGYHFDADYLSIIQLQLAFTLVKQKYLAREVVILELELLFEMVDAYAKFVDLLKLVPAKFRDSELLQQLLYVDGLTLGTWLSKIKDLEPLLDPYRTSDAFIQKLGDLIGFAILSDETTPLEEKRRQLIEAISWYKIKGTYQAILIILYAAGVNAQVYDLWTNDYITFVRRPWLAWGVDGTK